MGTIGLAASINLFTASLFGAQLPSLIDLVRILAALGFGYVGVGVFSFTEKAQGLTDLRRQLATNPHAFVREREEYLSSQLNRKSTQRGLANIAAGFAGVVAAVLLWCVHLLVAM